jgi:hypothetical protein
MQQKYIKAGLTISRGSKHRPALDRRAELEQRKRQLEARISALDARESIARRKRETRANIVLGAVMRAHAALNPSFAGELVGILDVGLRRPADRLLLAEILSLPRLMESPLPSPTNNRPTLRHPAKELIGRQAEHGFAGHL